MKTYKFKLYNDNDYGYVNYESSGIKDDVIFEECKKAGVGKHI